MATTSRSETGPPSASAGMAPDVDPHGDASAGLSGRQRVALALLLTASFTLAVDFSILSVALPRVGADVGFSLQHLQWIATAFALCAAGFTLFFGRLADFAGRKRMFLIGIAVLAIGSLVGGLATTPWVLIAARVTQGLATAAVGPAALSLLTTSFPEGPQRDRAIGLNGALMAAGFTTGAILGGVLTDLLSWRWAFFINIPIALAVLILGPAFIKETASPRRRSLDVPGALTVTAALLAVIFGLTSAGDHAWSDARVWVPLVAGAALLVAFWRIEKSTPHALVPVTILAKNTVAWGNLAGLLAFATETSLVFLLTLYLQKSLDFSPLGAGLAFGVLGIGTVVGGVFAPRWIGRFGNKATLVGGFGVQAVATVALLLLGLDRGPAMVLLLVATFVGGVANLAAIVGYVVTATSGLADHEQGLATGLTTMSQQVGITLGIPIMSTIVAVNLPRTLSQPTAQTVLDAVRPAIAVNAGLCVLTAVLVAVFLTMVRPAAV